MNLLVCCRNMLQCHIHSQSGIKFKWAANGCRGDSKDLIWVSHLDPVSVSAKGPNCWRWAGVRGLTCAWISSPQPPVSQNVVLAIHISECINCQLKGHWTTSALSPNFFQKSWDFYIIRSVYLCSDCMLNLTCSFNLVTKIYAFFFQ